MFFFQVLGTASATPVYGRHLSAHIVGHNDRYYLVDCGEATQFQFLRFRVRTRRLDAIFISHLHGDHIYGLPGLLTSMSLNGRTAALDLFGPKGIGAFVWGTLRHSDAHLSYELRVKELEVMVHETPVFESDNLSVLAFPLLHRVPCLGYRFQEKQRRRKFRVEMAQSLGVPTDYYHLLKHENAITLPDGRRIEPDDVLGTAPRPMAMAYCSDTAPFPELIPHIQGVDLLFHEATFVAADAARATETLHSTAPQAANAAAQAGATRLLLGHFSARYMDLAPLLAEARAVFPTAELAEEGRIYPIDPNAPWDGQQG